MSRSLCPYGCKHNTAILIIEQTVSTLSSFILFMVKHPEVQKKAQEEIRRVIGQDRLPTFEDRDSLPYVESILIEVLRLRPPVSAGTIFTELLQLDHAFLTIIHLQSLGKRDRTTCTMDSLWREILS